jgi:hypothetical protein
MFPEPQKTNPMTDLPMNWFEDESRDYANQWDGQALRAAQKVDAHPETTTPTCTPTSTMTMRG